MFCFLLPKLPLYEPRRQPQTERCRYLEQRPRQAVELEDNIARGRRAGIPHSMYRASRIEDHAVRRDALTERFHFAFRQRGLSIAADRTAALRSSA